MDPEEFILNQYKTVRSFYSNVGYPSNLRQIKMGLLETALIKNAWLYYELHEDKEE